MPKTTTCGKRAPPSIKEEHRRKKLEVRLGLLDRPAAQIKWVNLEMRKGSFGPRKLAAVWERLAEMLFAVIRRRFGTLLDGLVVKNVDAVSAEYRKLCVEHMASVQPTAPFLMDFTETVVKLDGVGRKRCMELL